MIKNKLIVIPFGFLWSWPADYEKQTALYSAKKNLVIAFLVNEGCTLKSYFQSILKGQRVTLLKEVQKNLFKFNPLYFIPFQRIRTIQNINYFLCVWQLRIIIFLNKKFRPKDKILWIFTSQLNLFPSWFGKNFFSLYDCVDQISSLDKKQDKERKKQEKKIIRQVKVVFSNSFSLLSLKKSLHPKVYLVPQGFNLKLFSQKKKFTLPSDLVKILSPRIGFIGNISYRLDFNFIKNLAISSPNYSLVFIGPNDSNRIQDIIAKTQKHLARLRKIKNIYFLGNKNKKQIPAYIYFLDFGFIPYDIKQEFNRSCYPMKVFEYFYMGKPVISTPIEELKRLQPLVKIAKNTQEFEKEIRKILKSGWPTKYKKQQRKLAIANSWQAKIEKISEILEKEFAGPYSY